MSVKSQDMRLTFYTPTQPPWAASGGIAGRFLRNRPAYTGGIGYPLYSGLYHLHQNLACDVLIQLRLDAVYAEGLDRLLEHDLLLRNAQTVLAVELLRDLLGGDCAEQTTACTALGRNLDRALLELFRCLARCLLLERNLACVRLVLRRA